MIDNTYFKNDIYVPEMKPDITNDVNSIDGSLIDFINEYTRECLIKSLGPVLFFNLESNLDYNESTLIKAGAHEKWDFLVNGRDGYLNSKGKLVNWRGLRYKSNPTKNVYDKSLLAYYTYFFYEQSKQSSRGTTGHVENDPKNAERVSATPKVVNAWNKFVVHTQGSDQSSSKVIYNEHLGYGVDYYKGHEDVNLRSYILDSNLLEEDYYPDFDGQLFKKMNVFGI